MLLHALTRMLELLSLDHVRRIAFVEPGATRCGDILGTKHVRIIRRKMGVKLASLSVDHVVLLRTPLPGRAHGDELNEGSDVVLLLSGGF